jgi:ectoine hydroxylase-related dioxygenase (phytanoyl-CoA dioxygenase family)
MMRRGSVLVYLGDTFHSGGANTSDSDRWGCNIDYNLAHLRQEENQFLACPPSVATTLPVPLQELVGYTMPGASFGYYAEYQHPRESLEGNARPVVWASKL